MDPIPSFNDVVNGSGNLSKDIATLAPLATSWSGAQTGVHINQITTASQAPPSSGLSKFAHFIGGVGSEIGHVTAGVTQWLGNQLTSAVQAPYKFGSAISHGWLDRSDLNQINAQSTQLSNQMDTLNAAFKAGRISANTYKSSLKELNQSFSNLSSQSAALDNRLQADQGQAVKAGIQTASDLVTILTAGFGKAASTSITADGLIPQGTKTAADYLASTNANALLSNVETGISKLASDPELFARLTPMAQTALQQGAAEVIAQSANMTAGQIARATAVNVAFKYPIYYNMLSTTGIQLYNELDQAKYGAAIRTAAFNAALLLSGGPIGKALEYGGEGLSIAKNAVFGESSFIDELSKGIGNGTPSGLYEAIAKLAPEEQASVVKQLSAVEATNLAAVGGDPVAAAWRVLNGMSSYEGTAMSTFSHEEALTNMVNFAKAQRIASETAQAFDLGNITVGRVDARDLNGISSFVSPMFEQGKEVMHQALDTLAQSESTRAWANNENFMKQVNALIDRAGSSTELDAGIRNIKASFAVEGFPKETAQELSKMGYLPIKPVNLEAPFVEGTGKLSSQFANNSDFFMKTVQPLPILSSIGTMFTKVGLSPEASTQQVYEIFNKNVAETLADTGAFKELSVVGDSSAQTADTIVKKLSDYARNLPARKLPITDLRLMSTGDIMKALEVSASDARDVRGALMNAMLKVPLEIRGLGDKVMDLNYKLNPLSRTYAKLQGAFRFAWNPFFQAKLATKTEFLSAMEGGGFVPSVFAGEYSQLDSTAKALQEGGFLDKKAGSFFGGFGGGESVNETGVASANISHKLLGVQEKSISGLVLSQADKVGMDVESYLKAYPQQVRDTIQSIVGYDRNASFLNSPMAKTLNLAFFPFRFELKVAELTAGALAKTSTMTQVAVIKGLYNGSNFLKSPQGQAWYSQNAEVIGLFKYFSPVATLSNIASALTGLGHESLQQTVGSFGELGGLPFGWIPQLLDAEGLTHFGQPYVNPKTGAVALDFVPVSARGQLQAAISDLIGSLYTYPGATVGLMSKGTIDRWAAAALTGGKAKTDFTTSTPNISPEQQNFQSVVQSVAGTKPNAPFAIPSQNSTQPIKVPPEPSPILKPLPKPISTRQSAAKKKKADFTPQLLPGQTRLGQL